MGLTFHTVLQRCSDHYQTLTISSDRATSSTVRADDFDVTSLRSLGRLQVKWTSCLQQHLLLNIPARTIEICWFPAEICSMKTESAFNSPYMAKWHL